MLAFDKPSQIAQRLGESAGPGPWVEVTQSMIDQFADLTGDHQWIHVDTERAAREMPGGKTIAHGYLILSLIGKLALPLYDIRGASRILNYGSDRIRFLSAVPSGSRLRASVRFTKAEPVSGGWRCTMEVTVEMEGQAKPAMVSEVISLNFD